MDRVYDNLTKSPDIEQAKTIAKRELSSYEKVMRYFVPTPLRISSRASRSASKST